MTDIDYDDADEALEEIIGLATVVGQMDLATFIEMMDERGYTEDDGSAELEDLDDVDIPIDDEKRTMTALLAFSAGAAIERKYSEHRLDNAEPATQPDDSFQG